MLVEDKLETLAGLESGLRIKRHDNGRRSRGTAAARPPWEEFSPADEGSGEFYPTKEYTSVYDIDWSDFRNAFG